MSMGVSTVAGEAAGDGVLAELGQEHGGLVVDAHGVGVRHHDVAQARGVSAADGLATGFAGPRGAVPLHRRQARLQRRELAAHAPGNGFAPPCCGQQDRCNRHGAHAGGGHGSNPRACPLHL